MKRLDPIVLLAIASLWGCDSLHEAPPVVERPAEVETVDDPAPVEREPPAVEAAPAALACAGIAMVDRGGQRLPELFVRALGDDLEGTRGGREFSNSLAIDPEAPAGARNWVVGWVHHRSSEGHWDISAARDRVRELFGDVRVVEREGPLGASILADLGDQPGGHVFYEQATSRTGGDRASLYCTSASDQTWSLTVGQARELGLLPARFPATVLTRLGDAAPLRGIAGTWTHLDVELTASTVPSDPLVADLRAAGFTDLEPNPYAGSAYQLEGGSPPIRALLFHRTRTITITTSAPDDQFLYDGGPG